MSKLFLLKTVISIIISIFLIEVVIMIIINSWIIIDNIFLEAFFDSVVLIVTLIPLFYFFIYKPLIKTIDKLQNSQSELLNSKRLLEEKNNELTVLNIEKRNHNFILEQAKIIAEENEKRFRDLTFSIGDWIWEVDINGRYTYSSCRGTDIFGLKEEEILGKTPFDFMPADESKRIAFVFSDIVEKQAPIKDLENWNINKNGELFCLLTNGVPIYDNKGVFKGYRGVDKDITEQKRLSDLLKKAKDEAELSDKLKSAFLANMSHEIRTPMNGILGFSQRLAKPDLSETKKKQYLEIIQSSGNQLMSIIDDLIDISKIEANQMKIYIAPANINNILRELFAVFKTRLKSAEVNLEVIEKYLDAECFIYTDENRLKQVLINLIGNAIKFTNIGTIKYGFEFKGEFIEFFVEDSGIGIPKDMQLKIFERFIQVESDYAKQIGGTGLGLAISKSLVELLGGKIWLSSELDKGSKFYFTIPYKVVENKRIESNNQASDFSKKADSFIVLIAEDEYANYYYLAELLAELNIETIHAKNGEEAVNFIKQKSRVDLVLMDLKMPVLNGIDAAKEIKIIRPEIPIVAQTAYVQSTDKQRAIDVGISDFIVKPIMESALKDVLNKFLN